MNRMLGRMAPKAAQTEPLKISLKDCLACSQVNTTIGSSFQDERVCFFMTTVARYSNLGTPLHLCVCVCVCMYVSKFRGRMEGGEKIETGTLIFMILVQWVHKFCRDSYA